MKAIKIQTTILLPDDSPVFPVARFVERIERTTRFEMMEAGFFSPGCVIVQQDETPGLPENVCAFPDEPTEAA